jgi:hypothetical protein
MEYRRNLLACVADEGYCDQSLLSPLDATKVAAIQSRRNALACEAEDETCNDSPSMEKPAVSGFQKGTRE